MHRSSTGRLSALMLASILVSPSRLILQAGDAQAVAEQARRTQLDSLEARVARVKGLIVSGNSSQAQAEIALLLKQAPDAAIVHALRGMHEARVSNPGAARLAYERALELSPGLLEAVAGLTYLDLSVRDTASAIKRLEHEIARQPGNPNFYVLLSRSYSVIGDLAKQEETLRRAVTAVPQFANGYTLLAELYARQRRLDEALAEYEAIAARDPSNVMATTMVGLLLELQGKRDEAMKAYERLVNGTEAAAVTANNLAFTYAEKGTNLDVALRLATTAKQRLPDDPRVDDTIGWIYYKKDLASLAVGPLEAASRRLPGSAEVLTHLGLTYAKLGEREKARQALERAFRIDPQVGGQEAKRALASVLEGGQK